MMFEDEDFFFTARNLKSSECKHMVQDFDEYLRSKGQPVTFWW